MVYICIMSKYIICITYTLYIKPKSLLTDSVQPSHQCETEEPNSSKLDS